MVRKIKTSEVNIENVSYDAVVETVSKVDEASAEEPVKQETTRNDAERLEKYDPTGNVAERVESLEDVKNVPEHVKRNRNMKLKRERAKDVVRR